MDETIKSDGSVSLIRENEDGSADFQFNFPPEALAALTRLGILTAIKAGIAEAECLNPDTPPAEETTSKDAALKQALEFLKFLGREVGMNDYAADKRDRIEAVLEDALEQTESEWVGLTDEQIADIVIEMNGNEPTGLFWRDLTRAIEAAHGIGDRT